ncbi:hypothetical protein [Bacillus pumilus]|uniref:hypothetical protein n=1 Tax=Bacillus pumilus TaxID=1408 RepID=UPI001653DE62|nr:hypothetical protein [Bacillus pumilus]
MVIRIPFEQDALKQAYLTQVGGTISFQKGKTPVFSFNNEEDYKKYRQLLLGGEESYQ